MSGKNSEKQVEDKIVRIGIIGAGNMGANHARRILDGTVPGAVLSAICDGDSEIVQKFMDKELGVEAKRDLSKNGNQDVQSYADAQALIESDQVDAIIIATPHYSHTPLSLACFAANKHVLVEKPLAVHVKDCQKTIDAFEARENKETVFAEMFNQRTNPIYKKLKQLIDEGELGEIRRVNWIITDWFRTESYYASGGWRATWEGEGGGVLVNQCPHQLDLMQWLFGMPSKVRAFAQCGYYHDIEVEDNVTAYLEYENGATGVFVASTGEAPGTNRLEVTAERGKIVIENDLMHFTRNEVEMSTWSKDTDLGFGKPAVWEIDIPCPGEQSGHLGIMCNFVAAIQKGDDLIASGVEGKNGVELCNAMLYSAFNDRTVTLPVDGDAYEAMLHKLIADSKQ